MIAPVRSGLTFRTRRFAFGGRNILSSIFALHLKVRGYVRVWSQIIFFMGVSHIFLTSLGGFLCVHVLGEGPQQVHKDFHNQQTKFTIRLQRSHSIPLPLTDLGLDYRWLKDDTRSLGRMKKLGSWCIWCNRNHNGSTIVPPWLHCTVLWGAMHRAASSNICLSGGMAAIAAQVSVGFGFHPAL